jgi:TonB family protein
MIFYTIPKKRVFGLMKQFWIFFLGGLILLGGCGKKKESEFQIYEFRVFLMEGSRLQEEPTLPLFPGEIAVQFLETAITDMEEIQEQLEKTFGYRQINFVDMKYFLFSAEEKSQEFFLQLGDQNYFRCIVFPFSFPEKLSVSVSLIQQQHIFAKTIREIRPIFDAEDASPLLFTRADIRPDQAIVLGRALGEENDQALFLVVKPAAKSIGNLSDFKVLAGEYANFLETYDPVYVSAFLKKIADHLKIPEDSLQLSTRPEHAAANIYDYVQLTVKPRIKDSAMPKYPVEAKKQGIEGSVLCQVLVDEQGKVIQSEIISSSNNALLDSAAIQSARQYTFYPGEVNGRPVKVGLAIPFKFKLK